MSDLKHCSATSYVAYPIGDGNDGGYVDIDTDNTLLLDADATGQVAHPNSLKDNASPSYDDRVLGLGLVDAFGRRAKDYLFNESTGTFLGRPQRRKGAHRMIHALGEDDYFSRTYIIFWGATMVTYAFLLYTAPDTINQEFEPPMNPWFRALYYLLFSIILGVTFVEILRLNRPTSTFLGKVVALVWIALMNVQAIAAIIVIVSDERASSLYRVQQGVLNAWRLFQIVVADLYALKLLWKLRWRNSKGIKFMPYAARLRDRQRTAVSDALDGRTTSVLPREPYVKSYLPPHRPVRDARNEAGNMLSLAQTSTPKHLEERNCVNRRHPSDSSSDRPCGHTPHRAGSDEAEPDEPLRSSALMRVYMCLCALKRRFHVWLHTYYLEEGVFVYPLLTQIAALSTPVLLFWLFIVLLFLVRMGASAVSNLEAKILSSQVDIAEVNGFLGNLSGYCRNLNQFTANMSNPPLPQQLQMYVFKRVLDVASSSTDRLSCTVLLGCVL